MTSSPDSAKHRSLLALDAMNVVLADVRDGLGPYLAIYLAARQHWDAGRIGIAMSVMTIASVIAQTPAGALIDRMRSKRALVVIAAIGVAVGAVVMVRRPTFLSIVGCQALIGVAGAIFPPAIAAISLGLVGHARLPRRMGRNEAYNHAGNVAAAVLAGYIGDEIAYEGIFYLLAGMALATVVATLLIRPGDIDHDLARGAERHEGANGAVATIGSLLRDHRILVFVAAVTLFHFANAAMLPLVGQKMTAGKSTGVSSAMSACIIAAQLVMVSVAILSSRWAESWGRKPVFLIGFAVLPVRGLLYTLTTKPAELVAIQFLDGIGAGIFGVVGVLVIADLTRGTGRFNLMQGVLATSVGAGASLSTLLTGFLVERLGFDAGFAFLSITALVALVFYAATMPETAQADRSPSPEDRSELPLSAEPTPAQS